MENGKLKMGMRESNMGNAALQVENRFGNIENMNRSMNLRANANLARFFIAFLALTLTLSLAPTGAKAQQEAQYSQYMFNGLFINDSSSVPCLLMLTIPAGNRGMFLGSPCFFQ